MYCKVFCLIPVGYRLPIQLKKTQTVLKKFSKVFCDFSVLWFSKLFIYACLLPEAFEIDWEERRGDRIQERRKLGQQALLQDEKLHLQFQRQGIAHNTNLRGPLTWRRTWDRES